MALLFYQAENGVGFDPADDPLLIASVKLRHDTCFLTYVRTWYIGCYQFCKSRGIPTDGFTSFLPSRPRPGDGELGIIDMEQLEKFRAPFPEMDVLKTLATQWVMGTRVIAHSEIVSMSALLEKIKPYGTILDPGPLIPQRIARLRAELKILYEQLRDAVDELGVVVKSDFEVYSALRNGADLGECPIVDGDHLRNVVSNTVDDDSMEQLKCMFDMVRWLGEITASALLGCVETMRVARA